MSSFYAHRSQKCKKSLMIWLSFLRFWDLHEKKLAHKLLVKSAPGIVTLGRIFILTKSVPTFLVMLTKCWFVRFRFVDTLKTSKVLIKSFVQVIFGRIWQIKKMINVKFSSFTKMVEKLIIKSSSGSRDLGSAKPFGNNCIFSQISNLNKIWSYMSNAKYNVWYSTWL